MCSVVITEYFLYMEQVINLIKIMSFNNVNGIVPSVLSNNSKVIALEFTLQQCVTSFRELVIDLEQLHNESENYKNKCIILQEKCESKSCSGSESLKKIIESKDHIIQLVASTLTRLIETKNFNLLNEAFKILFGETIQVNHDEETISMISPKEESHSPLEEVPFGDESISEVEGTPTGRKSPIIQTKKLRSTAVISSDHRDKKKCPENWPTPENKAVKLLFPFPTRSKSNGRLKQSRLNLVQVKHRSVVDLTCSPEFSDACSTGRSASGCNGPQQPLIKKESIDNEDTILPSPTSGPTNFNLLKSSRASPMKFKKPALRLKLKKESISNADSKLEEVQKENLCIDDIKNNESSIAEDSINILNPNRLPSNCLKDSPKKRNNCGNDTTYCDTFESSVSVLKDINKLDTNNTDFNQISPSKRPLVENINITNVQYNEELELSVSVLQHDVKTNIVNKVKRTIPELVETVYKEPAVRKKAEKRLLPGWSCDECKHFFGELYKEDPEMYAKKIDECSKHRAKHNPARPKTPPNFWNPRWNVPDDTEEFNRKNNVA